MYSSTISEVVHSVPFPCRQGNSWPVLFLCLALAVPSFSCTDTEKNEPVSQGRENPFQGLGKVLALGPNATGLKAVGTTPVAASKLPGAQEALEQRRGDSLAKVLDRAGIKNILVDPSLAVRAPLPRDDVLTRLALLRSLKEFSAKLITKDLVLYERVKPFEPYSEATMSYLLAVARAVMKGGKGDVSGPVPAEARRKGSFEVILCLRPHARHIGFYRAQANTLEKAVRAAARSAAKGYDRKKSARKYGPLPRALDKVLTVELGIVFDKGVLKGRRDMELLWRAFEPGLYGAAVKKGGRKFALPPWYSVTRNKDTAQDFLDALFRWAELEKMSYLKEDVELERFRMFHFREVGPAGRPEVLHRAFPDPPSMKDVTKENVKKAIAGLARWIRVNQVHESGRFVYRYFPSVDKYSKEEEFNFVRHCVGVFGLLLAQEIAPNPENLETVEAGWRFMEAHLRWGGPPLDEAGKPLGNVKTWHGKPLPGPDVALLMYKPSDSGLPVAKMGAAAVAVLGLTQAERAGVKLDDKRKKLLDGLANFISYMERKEGGFHHYYVSKGSGLYDWRNSIYPGEILYAVARLYGKYRDEKWRRIFKRSMKSNMQWFKERMAKKGPDGLYKEKLRKELVQFQPWIAMAMEEMYRYDPDPSYVEASNLVSKWIVENYQYTPERAPYPDYLGGYFKVFFEVPAMHTFVYTEGTAASYMLAKRAGLAEKELEKFAVPALTAARFIMQQQVVEGRNDYFFPNPRLAWGGVRYCLTHNKQRIDYTYHAISALYRVYKAMDKGDLDAFGRVEEPTWD